MLVVAAAAIVFWVSQVPYKCLDSRSDGSRDGTPALIPCASPSICLVNLLGLVSHWH